MFTSNTSFMAMLVICIVIYKGVFSYPKATWIHITYNKSIVINYNISFHNPDPYLRETPLRPIAVK